jgi:hypothetical protein
VTPLRALSCPHLPVLNAHSSRQATVWASCPCHNIAITLLQPISCSPPPINSNNKCKSSMIRHHRVLEKSSLQPTFTARPLPNSVYSVFLQHGMLTVRFSEAWHREAWYKLTFLGFSSLPPQGWLNWRWRQYVGLIVPDYTMSQAKLISRSKFH